MFCFSSFISPFSHNGFLLKSAALNHLNSEKMNVNPCSCEEKKNNPSLASYIQPFILPGLMVFSEAKPASELSEGMLWMDDRGMSVSVLVSHVDSVSLVQLSR